MRHTISFIALAFAVSAAPALAKKPSNGFQPAVPQAPAARPSDGSIFNVNAGYAGLVTGNRAHAVGDPISIVLIERTTTAKSVGMTTNRDGGASITPPTSGPLSFLNPNALKASSQSSFKGAGNTSQTSSLAGEVGVTIQEVRPNGTALVRGEKRMLLNHGYEWVQFSGIVRLSDIDEDNRILSSRVADARMEYTGNGSFQRAGREGWLGRFFSLISPF